MNFNLSANDIGSVDAWLQSVKENPDTYTANSVPLTDAVTGQSLTLVPPAATVPQES
jgi:hypothetical protein